MFKMTDKELKAIERVLLDLEVSNKERKEKEKESLILYIPKRGGHKNDHISISTSDRIYRINSYGKTKPMDLKGGKMENQNKKELKKLLAKMYGAQILPHWEEIEKKLVIVIAATCYCGDQGDVPLCKLNKLFNEIMEG